jgi:hypothetical protein
MKWKKSGVPGQGRRERPMCQVYWSGSHRALASLERQSQPNTELEASCTTPRHDRAEKDDRVAQTTTYVGGTMARLWQRVR